MIWYDVKGRRKNRGRWPPHFFTTILFFSIVLPPVTRHVDFSKSVPAMCRRCSRCCRGAARGRAKQDKLEALTMIGLPPVDQFLLINFCTVVSCPRLGAIIPSQLLCQHWGVGRESVECCWWRAWLCLPFLVQMILQPTELEKIWLK